MATQLMKPREVPLGGLRAITVRRTLPAKDRSFVGAWCFVDHYGPQRVRANNEGGMDVPPHPHTGLQTVSWLFEGEIEHRDSGGAIGQVRPGEVNLMTSGAGICHSEVSTESTDVLHGVQLWAVLPDADRHTVRNFEHFAAEPVALADDAGTARVFLGSLADVAESPVHTYTPLLGAQLDLAPDAKVTLRLDPTFEHGVLLDTGAVSVDGEPLEFGDLVCQDEGPDSLVLQAGPDGARIILLAVSRSRRRSSCGGTSSGAPMTRSSSSVSSGRHRPSVSARSRGTRARRCGSRPRSCPVSGCVRATVAANGLRETLNYP